MNKPFRRFLKTPEGKVGLATLLTAGGATTGGIFALLNNLVGVNLASMFMLFATAFMIIAVQNMDANVQRRLLLAFELKMRTLAPHVFEESVEEKLNRYINEFLIQLEELIQFLNRLQNYLLRLREMISRKEEEKLELLRFQKAAEKEDADSVHYFRSRVDRGQELIERLRTQQSMCEQVLEVAKRRLKSAHQFDERLRAEYDALEEAHQLDVEQQAVFRGTETVSMETQQATDRSLQELFQSLSREYDRLRDFVELATDGDLENLETAVYETQTLEEMERLEREGAAMMAVTRASKSPKPSTNQSEVKAHAEAPNELEELFRKR